MDWFFIFFLENKVPQKKKKNEKKKLCVVVQVKLFQLVVKMFQLVCGAAGKNGECEPIPLGSASSSPLLNPFFRGWGLHEERV